MRTIALILLAAIVEAKHDVHGALEAIHRRHRHERELARNETVEKRGGSCAFPTDAGLIAVTPGSGNGGWAFAPDQTCSYGRYCPYACPAGQVSMQWDPSATSYTYPQSMNGGLLCGTDGKLTKPFPDRPYCQATAKNIGVTNNVGQTLSFCQTVLPGDEDMLIPTIVDSWSSLAVPDTSYWAGTAAHYYINPPGTGAEGCIWGSNANPVGNWAPYVAGANSDSTGETFIKLGWNPIYLEPTTPFRNTMPSWGVKIDCPNGGCNGLPCAIDPSQNGVNEMVGSSSNGAGGGAFCVVTVQKGATANFIVFNPAKAGQFYQSSAASSSSSVSVQSTTAVSDTTSHTTSTSATAHSSSTGSQKTTSVSSSSVSSSIPTSYSQSASGTTTSSSRSPSEQPYYSLFNSTVSATGGGNGASKSPVPAASNTIVATHTGGSSRIAASLTSIVIMMVCLL